MGGRGSASGAKTVGGAKVIGKQAINEMRSAPVYDRIPSGWEVNNFGQPNSEFLLINNGGNPLERGYEVGWVRRKRRG